MNNGKMTSKTIKLSIFAVIIFSMVVPVSAGNNTIMASAQTQDDSQRLAQKISDINQNFAEYLKTQQAAMNAELQIYDIDQKIAKQNNLNDIAGVSLLVAQKATLETKLNTLLQEIDALQEQSYTLHEIPDAKMQKLKEVKSQVIQQYATSDRLDTIFIDAAEESIQVILLSTSAGSNNGTTTTIPSDSVTPKRSARSVGDDYPSLAEKYGIAVEVKEFTTSSRTSTHIQDGDVRDCTSSTKNQNCGPLAGGVEICTKYKKNQCDPLTLGFPATRNGVSGFVTVAHGFAYDDKIQTGNFNDPLLNKVYQKGPSSSYTRNFDTVYVRELIGTLVYGTYDNSVKGDSAFVQLQSGARTLPQEIVSSGTTNFDIAGYSKSDNDNRIGAYVAKSGMKTGVTAGKIVFGNSTDVFATYNECTGDSGSPVGKLRGFSFTVYGMHLGTSDDPNYNIQKCGKNHDGYSRYVPYTKIKSDLNLD